MCLQLVNCSTVGKINWQGLLLRWVKPFSHDLCGLVPSDQSCDNYQEPGSFIVTQQTIRVVLFPTRLWGARILHGFSCSYVFWKGLHFTDFEESFLFSFPAHNTCGQVSLWLVLLRGSGYGFEKIWDGFLHRVDILEARRRFKSHRKAVVVYG